MIDESGAQNTETLDKCWLLLPMDYEGLFLPYFMFFPDLGPVEKQQILVE